MGNSGIICHSGIIKSIDNQHIIVTVLSQAACVSCHAKGACSAADIQEKEIEITKWQGEYTQGERVEIISNNSQGFRAVFLAYVLPLILMVTELVIGSIATDNEVITAIGALIILCAYYFMLYLFRQNVMKSMKFELRKSAKLNQYE